MKSLKIHFEKLGEITCLVILFSLFLQGCMQAPNSKRSGIKSGNTTTASKDTSTKLPEFTTGNNFIQNGVNVSTSTVNLDLSFSDYLQLRGKDIDGYVRKSGTQNVVCLTARFPTSVPKKLVVLAAVPRSVYNFTTKALEYYYNLSPGDSTTNQSFCQKTGIINQLGNLYSDYTLAYTLSAPCPNGTCNASTFTSSPMEMYTSSGTALSQIATKQLTFNLTVTANNSAPVGQTCTDSSQCTSQGYDCCSLGQCVNDLALKPGVTTTSPEYLQALQDILNNPSNIYLYPQYYFICSSPVNTPTAPTSPSNPTSDANKRLKNLEDLYNCTNKIEGEYGLCTKTIKDAVIGTTYQSGLDDRSFSDTFTNIDVEKMTLVSVEQVIYGDVVVYDYTVKDELDLVQDTYDNGIVRIKGSQNDALDSGTLVTIVGPVPGAVSKDLVIKYKIDASCKEVSSGLAKCEKYYIQGQKNSGDSQASNRRGRLTDHYPASTNTFKIPRYANTDKAITVEVDGVLQKQDIDWQLNKAAISTIQFLPINTTNVFEGQKVRISYFVNTVQDNVLLTKKQKLEEIQKICTCASTNCGLTPVKNASNQITDYACVYPDPNPVDPPVSQKIYLSSKTVPVRFFDDAGISQKTVNANTTQEGLPFFYNNDDLLKPNNLDGYVGFNEIYGSISYKNNSAKPAYEVAVKKGSTYDIYVDRGAFSNCVQCGNDYNSQLTKLFPLTQFGGGLVPLIGQTNRTMSNGVRADDMSFGRACLLPATMIPWTHNPESSNKIQRNNRMSAQHFLYANGYQHDWYGFDYGSVIGSFDGVKWFAIGTNRRIKAETNKMFIAVNGMFGDLTLESTYEVTINDGILNPVGSNMNASDYTSDGAQCQQYHQCSNDNECVTTLGWDYACAPVGEITTTWPKFDDNAKEIPETTLDSTNNLTTILGISNTGGKRCVYRGRGSLCTQAYNSVNANSTFNQSLSQSLHSCSASNYCQPTTASNGTPLAKFNNSIVRYGKVRSDITVDSFGLAALIPGRPSAFNPVQTPQAETLKNLNFNKAFALCLPGHDVDQNSYLEQNRKAPTSTAFNGDKVLGIGMTNSTQGGNYLASCSVMDANKDLYRNSTTSASASFLNTTVYENLIFDSGAQSISTNALYAFKQIFDVKNIAFGLYKNNTDPLSSAAYNENRCMRAPGASCFTDMDCAPSKTLTNKIKLLSASDTSVTAILNAYEIKFWQEELICSQSVAKTSASYDPANNRCCRDVGNTISLPSADLTNALHYDVVPGIDYAISEKNRYSRAATMYKEVNKDATNYPELRVPIKDQCSAPNTCQSTALLVNQYRTFSSLAEKTSCSGDWIRSFSSGTNVKWEVTRFQKFPPLMFRCMNWYPGTGGYTCDSDPDDPSCALAQTPPNSAKAKDIFDYLGRMELMGIPQIALESETYMRTTGDSMACRSHPTDRNQPYPDHPNPALSTADYFPPTQLFPTVLSSKEYSDVDKGQMYSADLSNFNSNNFKQIFKSDEVRGCLPAGTQMQTGDDPAKCCTGMINPSNNKCQLNDYIDLSIYTNRFVSSEAKKLNLSLFDSNGYLRDPAYAAKLACERQMCASGFVAYGVLISRLKTPGQENASADEKLYRFLEGSTNADNQNQILDLYNAGLKLNNHAYCIPEALANSTSDDLTVISCGY